jgi:hypothetical protein
MLTIRFDEKQIGRRVPAMLLRTMTRARKSAIKSLGWWIRSQLALHIDYGGTGWAPLHPLSKRFRKKYGVKRWGQTRTKLADRPYDWLSKFARYRVNPEGTYLDVDFGKSKKGAPGTVDPGLVAIAKRAEHGATMTVSDDTRRLMGATRLGRKRPKPGVTFFPLKKTTTRLHLPARPIFGPVERRVRPQAPGVFQKKFFAAIQRYTAGGRKA